MTEEGQGKPGTEVPGSAVERVPLKVVPYFVEPLADRDEPEPPAAAPEPVGVVRRKTRALGILSLLVAVLTGVAQVMAIVIASDGGYVMGTLLGYLAIGLSVLAVAPGIAALITGRGRRWALAGVLLGTLANPWVLLWLLTAVGG